MLQSYLKIALRSLRANVLYTAINVGGLSVGVAACIVMLLYVHHEYTFDAFHPDAERVYRIVSHIRLNTDEPITSQEVSGVMADELRAAFPDDIESVVRYEDGLTALVRKGDVSVYEENHIAYADPTLFTRFRFPIVHGSANALSQPTNIVLTAQAARKYFGKTNVVGEHLRLKLEENSIKEELMEYRIGAVLEDLPSNTFVHADIFLSFEIPIQKFRRNFPDGHLWNNIYAQTFLKLRAVNGSSAATVLSERMSV